MSHKYVLLKEVCEKASSNIAQKDLAECDGIYPIYGASGYIKSVDFFQQAKDYIAIVKDGAGIGRAIKLPAKSSVIGTMQYVLPKDNINISYLYYAICSMHLEKYFSGATIPHIYFRDYQNEQLPLPTLEEQAKIANVFGRIDYFIKKEKEQLINLDKLVKSRFIELFGDLNISPKYPSVDLNSVCKMITGGTPSSKHPEYYGGNIPFVSTPCLGKNYIDEKDAVYFITEEGLKNSTTHLIPAGSLMFGNRVGVGKSSINKCAMCTNQDIVSITNVDSQKFDLLFIKAVLDQFSSTYDNNKRGATIKGIPTSVVKATQIPNVSINVQHLYTNFVKQVDKSKFVVTAKFQ